MVAATEHLKELGISVTELVEKHFELFKLELRDDARSAVQELATIVGMIPLLVLGWAFLCLALGVLLGRAMPYDLAFLLVGVLNLGIAAAGGGVALSKLISHRWLPRTQREVDASMHTVEEVTHLGPPAGASHA
jgi:uncharacterized membrane protein YqjE